MDNIVVPVDFSEVTDKVVDFACMMAEKFQARVWLVHIAQPHPDFVAINVTEQDWESVQVKERHQPLLEYARNVRNRGLKVAPVLVEGPAVEAIEEIAQQVAADMIVIGSHGHGALYDLLVGSVSEGVVRYSKVPVAIVPFERGGARSPG